MAPSGGSIVIRVAIIIILLGLSAFFSSSETAFTAVDKIRIRTLAEGENKSTQWVMKLSENQEKMLSAILIDSSVVNLSTSSMLTVLVTEVFGNEAARAATGVLTLLILILGEIMPRTIATLEAEWYSLRVGHMVHILMTVLTPLIILINWVSLIVLKALHVDPDKKNDNIMEGELRTVVDVGYGRGIVESEEYEMIDNMSGLGSSVARDVMIPRINMVLVDIKADYDDLIQIFKGEHHTRLPVYKEATDNVVDIISVKDLLLMEDKVSFCVSDYLRQSFCTSESKKLSELTVETKRSPNSTTIILDEHGATARLITLKNVLEEIVGDIRDECDGDRKEELVDLGDDQYLTEGLVKLDDLDDTLDLELSSKDYDSVRSLITDRLEHLLSQSEEVVCGNVHLVVGQVEKSHINEAHLYVLPEEKEESIEGRRNSS